MVLVPQLLTGTKVEPSCVAALAVVGTMSIAVDAASRRRMRIPGKCAPQHSQLLDTTLPEFP